MDTPAVIRPAIETDFHAIQRIYSFYVLNSLSTFEETAPSTSELLSRWTAINELGLPFLVAVTHEQVVGYAYASPYRARPAYRFTVEDSVYVEQGCQGQGIGKLLLSALIAHCEASGFSQMVAIIGGSGNAASIALHQRLSFETIGTLRNVGCKFGEWADTVIMQRSLSSP
jgi:L-amino acid N-acyltransferase YncA